LNADRLHRESIVCAEALAGDLGVPVESLVVITDMSDGRIVFVG
jgi:hypothetical protein